MKLQDLELILNSKIFYIWVDDDCYQFKNTYDMYKTYGEYEVEKICDDYTCDESHMDIYLKSSHIQIQHIAKNINLVDYCLELMTEFNSLENINKSFDLENSKEILEGLSDTELIKKMHLVKDLINTHKVNKYIKEELK